MTFQQNVTMAHSMIDELNADGLELIISIIQSLDKSKWINKNDPAYMQSVDSEMSANRKAAFERIEERRKKYAGTQTIDYEQARKNALADKYGVDLL